MYNEINLVGVVGYAHNKYVNNVMRVLFTVKELQNGIISDVDSETILFTLHTHTHTLCICGVYVVYALSL